MQEDDLEEVRAQRIPNEDVPGRIKPTGRERPSAQRGKKKSSTTSPLIHLVIIPFIGMLTIFPSIFGFVFLPSADWVGASKPYWLASGLFSAAMLFWLTWRIPQKQGEEMAIRILWWIWHPNRFWRAVGKTFSSLFMSLFGFLSGKFAALITIPMVAATVAGLGGSELELPYTIESGVHPGRKRCIDSIYLAEPPIMFNKLCGIEGGQMEGKPILVGGYGTRLGIWATYIRHAN